MTVTTQTTRVDYTANGVQTVFPYTFPIFASGDLAVYDDGTLLALTTHYTVSGAGQPAGGNVTFLTAPLSGHAIAILSDVDATQETDLQDGGPLPAESVESQADRVIRIVQQLGRDLRRTLLFPTFSTMVDKGLDELVAGRFLVVKDDLSGIRMADIATITPGAVALPLTLANGGTEATTALGARVSLGLDGQIRKVLTNRTGGSLVAGDVVTFDASNDDSVVLGDTVSSKATFAIAAEAIASLATGEFILEGVATVNVTGAVVRGRYLRKSNATKVAEDSTTAMTAANDPPQGAFAVALRANSGGAVLAYLFGTTYNAGQTPILGTYEVRGLNGVNNTGTPTTQYDLDADHVQLFRPSDGTVVIRQDPGVLTNNVATAGPAAGGRDQAGAFSANSWIHLYWIWNGTTLSTVSSAAAPTGAAGPTMPATYTHWAYAGAVRFNNSSNIVPTRLKGAHAYYDAAQLALDDGSATAETTVDLAAFVPPNALAYTLEVYGHVTQAGSSALTEADLFLKVVAGSTAAKFKAKVTGVSDGNTKAANIQGFPTLPRTGTLIYQWSNITGTPTKSVDLSVTGYRVPNGGE